ncbi:XRE family transcriptional regulator [Eubacteriales bacterium OttesenSCG-928-K08]|nr:XRE family transcriptional regulator [Eubacteriales bacterium OttesenSCG-928-K08]
MDDINRIFSENLKLLRARRKLSLDTLARESGVSKSMLGQIERGEANPTITTVWKIASGLKIPYSELMGSRADSQLELVRDVVPQTEDEGRFRNYMLFPFDSVCGFEMLTVELDPGGCLEAEPHPDGTQEFICVFDGELSVCVAGQTLVAGPGEGVRFKADAPHSYKNAGAVRCRASMVICYA